PERYAHLYDMAFADLPAQTQYRPSIDETDGMVLTNRHALHLYVLVLRDGAFRVARDDIVDALLAENIGAAVHYRATHTHRWYRETYGYRPEDFPNAYRVGEHTLSLPLTPGMSEADVEDV